MKARLTLEAEKDLDAAIVWYDLKARGLGDEFLRCIDACIASLERYPETHPIVHEETRRALVRRFPYAIFYEIEKREIIIYGIYHCARDPKSWRRKRNA
ncbi:MAG TPA: type II toxin-antitoxin system RelE/ParE family toxin [Acidobacteriota bacterium]